MKIVIYLIIIFIFFLGAVQSISAQACSCGGVPLLSSLESSTTPSGQWQFGFTYEYNSIADLVVGSEELTDNTRQRIIHSGKMEIGYGLNHRFSFLVIFCNK